VDSEDISENGIKAVVYGDFLHVVTKKGKYMRIKITE